MNRRGAVLLTVLWLVVLLMSIAAASLSAARSGWFKSRNRVLIRRGTWAARGCVAILQARHADRGKSLSLDTVDLGRGTWCAVHINPELGDPITATVVGGVHGQPVVSVATIRFRAAGKRLAILSQEYP